jgi:hypothetical protein
MNETFSCDDVNSNLASEVIIDNLNLNKDININISKNSQDYHIENENENNNNNKKNKNKKFSSEKKLPNYLNIIEKFNSNSVKSLNDFFQNKNKNKEKTKEIKKNQKENNQDQYQNQYQYQNQDETNQNFNSNRNLFEDTNILNKEDNQEINNLILQKLKQKNSDLDFEFQESNINISENISNNNQNNNFFSPYLIKKSEEIDLNSINNLKIYTKIPYEIYKRKNFSKIICENITTIKIKNKKFSYLTNLINNENYFFIKFSKENFLFFLEDFNYYNLNSLKKTKIPYRIYKKFVVNMNSKVLDVEFLLRNFKFKFFMKFLGIIFFSFLVFFSALFFFNKFSSRIFYLTPKEVKYILIIIGFIYIFFLIFFIYFYLFTKKIEYNHIKILMKKKGELDSLLYKWNTDYFINKMNYIASVPETFEYIQISLKPNKKLELQHHNI